MNYFASPRCDECDASLTLEEKDAWLRNDNAKSLLESLETMCEEAEIGEIPFAEMMELYRRKKAKNEAE